MRSISIQSGAPMKYSYANNARQIAITVKTSITRLAEGGLRAHFDIRRSQSGFIA